MKPLTKWRRNRWFFWKLVWRWEFKLQDFWVGAYWTASKEQQYMDLWVCVVPCFPLHFVRVI